MHTFLAMGLQQQSASAVAARLQQAAAAASIYRHALQRSLCKGLRTIFLSDFDFFVGGVAAALAAVLNTAWKSLQGEQKAGHHTLAALFHEPGHTCLLFTACNFTESREAALAADLLANSRTLQQEHVHICHKRISFPFCNLTDVSTSCSWVAATEQCFEDADFFEVSN